jgi:hypothetical protein
MGGRVPGRVRREVLCAASVRIWVDFSSVEVGEVGAGGRGDRFAWSRCGRLARDPPGKARPRRCGFRIAPGVPSRFVRSALATVGRLSML